MRSRLRASSIRSLVLTSLVGELALGCAHDDRTTTTPAASPTTDTAEHARTTPARAFAFDVETTVPLTADEAFAAFTGDVRAWWDHTFSEGTPAALVIESFAGGTFYEALAPGGGSVVHARVIYAEPGKLLRFVGPLGLSGRAIEMVHTFTFTELPEGGARVSLHLEGVGDVDDELVGVVESVWRHFLVDRYSAHARSLSNSSAAAPTPALLYAQPPPAAASSVGLGFFSHADLGIARNHLHADDFVVEEDATITAVRWWGLPGPADPGQAMTHEGLTNVSGFVVRVHEGSAGDGGVVAPGRLLFERNVTLAETHPTPTGRRGFGRGEASPGLEVRHEITLDAGPVLRRGVPYMLSIQAFRIDPAGDGWQWQDGIVRNRTSFSRPWVGSTWSTLVDTDSAFELIGAPQQAAPTAPLGVSRDGPAGAP